MTTRAAWRDASWFRYPGRARRFHVLRTDDSAACGLPGFLCVDGSRVVDDVPRELRCRRNGCRQLWPAIEVKR